MLSPLHPPQRTPSPPTHTRTLGSVLTLVIVDVVLGQVASQDHGAGTPGGTGPAGADRQGSVQVLWLQHGCWGTPPAQPAPMTDVLIQN